MYGFGKGRSVRRTAGIALLVCLLLALPFLPMRSHDARAQEEGVPERSTTMADALRTVHLRDVRPGFSVLSAHDAASSNTITAWKVDPSRFEFQLVETDHSKGRHAAWFLDHAHGLLAVNAGYFARRQDGSIYPVGFLKIDGRSRSVPWDAGTGGLLSFSSGKMSIDVPLPAKAVRDALENAVQSKPVMIEPGGVWAMRSNRKILKNRTAVCLLPDGHVLIIAVSGRGLSLYELAVLMKKPGEDGFFGCEAAIALDGGSSTQAAYALDPKLDVVSPAPVQNALVVREAG